ncbi:hypothetical protein [Streptomyces sp. NPDC056194]|uniref:hypothetical protein n=1 Tax=unclassified Streptomyces TaxID=2593676 RepID=UPI0035DE2253
MLAVVAAVLAFAIGVRRRAAFTRITRRHHAEGLWPHGWYCHRCGTVHFADAPGEDRRPLSLQRFREKIWERGDYGDPAAQQRAVDPIRS